MGTMGYNPEQMQTMLDATSVVINKNEEMYNPIREVFAKIKSDEVYGDCTYRDNMLEAIEPVEGMLTKDVAQMFENAKNILKEAAANFEMAIATNLKSIEEAKENAAAVRTKTTGGK